MTKLADHREEELFKLVSEIIEVARGHVSRTVNSVMVHAYWLTGREIVEVEQRGKERADYGEDPMNRLAERFATRYGKDFGARTGYSEYANGRKRLVPLLW